MGAWSQPCALPHSGRAAPSVLGRGLLCSEGFRLPSKAPPDGQKDQGRLTSLSQAVGVLPVALRDGACLPRAAALRAFPASGTRRIALGRAEGISEDRVLLLPHKDSVTKSSTWIRLTSPTLRPWISE